MTQVVNHKGKRLKVGPRGGGYHIYIYIHTIFKVLGGGRGLGLGDVYVYIRVLGILGCRVLGLGMCICKLSFRAYIVRILADMYSICGVCRGYTGLHRDVIYRV